MSAESYLEHFGLEEPPFGLTPDPDFVYWSKQHARAKAYMESTVWLADGFVIITGEIGSGKTTLLKSFLSELGDDIVYAVVSQTQLTSTQFLQAVLAEFGFKPFQKRKAELLDMLNMFLVEQYQVGKKVMLIVDEAQNLDREVLEEIRMLSGIETTKEKVLRIILAGQPELRDTLETPELKQLVQRVRLRFHIGPLDRREMREYIEHRLKIAGRTGDAIFHEQTFPVIYRYSGGVPRLINTLCDTSMLCAFADDKHTVDADDIEATAKELNWEEHEDSTGPHRQVPHLVPQPDAKDYLARIEVVDSGKVIEEHLFEAGTVIIGRAPDNEIYIKSKFVSRHHAQLHVEHSGTYIEDLNSTNGVFIDEKRVDKKLLQDGDIISLGRHELVYRSLRDARARDDDRDDDDTAVNEIPR